MLKANVEAWATVALFATVHLTACTQTERAAEIVIPAMLTDPVSVPKWAGTTNGDLVGYIVDLRAVIERCNADRAAVKKLLQPKTIN